jgi:hypothetical protein
LSWLLFSVKLLNYIAKDARSLKKSRNSSRLSYFLTSTPYLPEETCFQQVGSSAGEGTTQPVTIFKK